jgi:hypothetical protein
MFVAPNSVHVSAGGVIVCGYARAQRMAAAAVTFTCEKCHGVWHDNHHYCPTCKKPIQLAVSCPSGAWRGLYNNWCARHKPECGKCNPDLDQESDKTHESKAEMKFNHLHDTTHGIGPTMCLVISVTSQRRCYVPKWCHA